MKKSFVKYIIALLLFGSNGVVTSHISMSSYEIVFLRTLIGSLLLITMFLITGNRFTFTKKKRNFLFISISGVVMGAAGADGCNMWIS